MTENHNSSKTITQILDLLRRKHRRSQKKLQTKHPDTHKQLQKVGFQPHQLRKHATRLLTGATVATALLAQPPNLSALPKNIVSDHLSKYAINHHLSVIDAFSQQMMQVLPQNREQLNPWEIGQINLLLEQTFKVTATAELQDHRLLHQFGMMGMEQHLKRYPGDSLDQHNEHRSAGMAPGLGAWHYFADSKNQLSEIDQQHEKYYVAVQTLYLPEWRENQPEIKEWYKYRKMLVINPQNGQVIVAVIADAGPALWTGKIFGGSPEVMQYLDLHQGRQSGKVIMLFLNDPEDKVPLGPLGYSV